MKRAAAYEKGDKNGLRWTLTLFPTEAYAQDAEMGIAEYEDFVFGACYADRKNGIQKWKEVEKSQQRVIRYLKGRKIQIEYIKKHCPEAARIPWQKYYPLNLYQYQRFNHPHYYFIRAVRKAKRILQKYLSKKQNLITRNWELQFLGEDNFSQLKKNLMVRNKINEFIPSIIIEDYLKKFQNDPVKYAHPLSMLLTLVVFSEKHYQE